MIIKSAIEFDIKITDPVYGSVIFGGKVNVKQMLFSIAHTSKVVDDEIKATYKLL